MDGLLRADAGNRGLVFDPRSKLCFMVTLCVFVIGGVGAGTVPWMAELLGVVPILLLFTVGRWKRAAAYALAYFLLAGFSRFLFPLLHGPAQSISAIFCMVILRLMPGLVMGAYLLETTTVSEFIAPWRSCSGCSLRCWRSSLPSMQLCGCERSVSAGRMQGSWWSTG